MPRFRGAHALTKRSASSPELFGSTAYRSTAIIGPSPLQWPWDPTGVREFLRDQPSDLTPRVLFLDDAPDRAASFLATHPGAVWVQTVEQCIELLEQPWDEVFLDHDLGGEVLVDHERPDCGMAVVRWLCEEPRPRLWDTRFVIQTHNPNAACMMVLHLQVMGFQVQASPFGVVTPTGRGANPGSLAGRLLRWLGGHRRIIV